MKLKANSSFIDVKMVIPAYGVDSHGFPTIWAVRQSMGTAKLNPHLVSSHSFVGDHVLRCFATKTNPVTGATAQLSDITFTFLIAIVAMSSATTRKI